MCFTMPAAPASRGAGCADDGADWRFSGCSCGVSGASPDGIVAVLAVLIVMTVRTVLLMLAVLAVLWRFLRRSATRQEPTNKAINTINTSNANNANSTVDMFITDTINQQCKHELISHHLISHPLEMAVCRLQRQHITTPTAPKTRS
jgi:MYXO-CTERM domain-containing protein